MLAFLLASIWSASVRCRRWRRRRSAFFWTGRFQSAVFVIARVNFVPSEKLCPFQQRLILSAGRGDPGLVSLFWTGVTRQCE